MAEPRDGAAMMVSGLERTKALKYERDRLVVVSATPIGTKVEDVS